MRFDDCASRPAARGPRGAAPPLALRARHVAFGKTPDEARAWVARVDQPNAELVEAAADPALEARLLFRLAAIKLAELDWSATDAVLSSAGERIGREGPLMFAIAARSCRVGIRRAERATSEWGHAAVGGRR